MVRRSRRTEVPPHRAEQYRRVAEGLQESAEALHTLEDDQYGNAIGILAVHSAIAWTDALTIAYQGVKHSGRDHTQAADLLLEAVGEADGIGEARKKLEAILQTKEEVSYQGDFYRVEDAMTLLTQLRGYCRWAAEQYERRPPAR